MKAGFGFSGGTTAQPSSFFKRGTAGSQKRSAFGVMGADGATAIPADGGKEDNPDAPTRGVQIADPIIASCVLQLHKVHLGPPSDPVVTYKLTTVPSSFTLPTLKVVTRAPQYGACRLTIAGAEDLPFVLQSTADGDGACAPVYRFANDAYLAIADMVGGVGPALGTDLPKAFVDDDKRGCPPDVYDNTNLWPLPCLDPETTTAKHATPDEHAILDVLAWAAFASVLAVLTAAPPHLVALFPGALRPYLLTLRAEVAVPLHVGLEERLRAIELQVQALDVLLADFTKQCRAAAVTAAVGSMLPEAQWPDLGDPMYKGAVRLCIALQRNPMVTPADLLRAAVWVSDAVAFLRDDDDSPPTLPKPLALSADLPLETIAFAGVIGFYCVVKEGATPEEAREVADALCGGSAYLSPRDRQSLVQFAKSPFAAIEACDRIGWVSQFT